MRSGRIRSAVRTRARTLTAPAPSAFGGRASRRTTCGWTSRSSAVSSMVTTRSPAGIAADSELSSVVFPALVPPEIRRFHPAPTIQRRSAPGAPAAPKASRSTGRARKRRMVTHGPSSASGGISACRRDPSARRASTIGDARSRRRPSGATTRSTSRTIPPASRSSSTVSRRPARSTYARPGPFSITSLTSGSESSGSRGPSPETSSVSSPSRCSNRAGVRRGASSRSSSASRVRTARARPGLSCSSR